MAQIYKNIPVKPATYAKVQMIAGANNRGLGDQVSAWVERDLPVCEHKLQGVEVEYAPSAVDSLQYVVEAVKVGWYCATCNRVYMGMPAPIIDAAQVVQP